MAFAKLETHGCLARAEPETVEAILDTAWRVASAQASRTDSLDRKAATLATFASLLTSLIATLGVRFVADADEVFALVIFLASLLTLVLAIASAVRALLPREY